MPAPIIRVKPHVLNGLKSLMVIGEPMEAAVPCGPVRFNTGAIERAEDRDYIVLTNYRLLHVTGRWFREHKDDCMTAVPRKQVASAEAKNFLIGCTVTFVVSDENNPYKTRQLSCENISKPDGEAIAKVLTNTFATKQCPACGKTLDDQFAFCPYCKFSVQRVCKSCGRMLEEEWVGCPHCGH
jgi:RNA polymerase subunit RPABC4/transcription elongation factor Spt4